MPSTRSELRAVYYHGTLSKHLPAIAKEGLRPRPFIWLGLDYKFAAQWATNRAARWEGNVLVYDPHTVLRIVLPLPLPTEPDPNLHDPRSVVTSTLIEPAYITRLSGDLWAPKKRWVKL